MKGLKILGTINQTSPCRKVGVCGGSLKARAKHTQREGTVRVPEMCEVEKAVPPPREQGPSVAALPSMAGRSVCMCVHAICTVSACLNLCGHSLRKTSIWCSWKENIWLLCVIRHSSWQILQIKTCHGFFSRKASLSRLPLLTTRRLIWKQKEYRQSRLESAPLGMRVSVLSRRTGTLAWKGGRQCFLWVLADYKKGNRQGKEMSPCELK